MKKGICLLLATAMLLSLTACRKKKNDAPQIPQDPYDTYDNYDDRSQAIYDDMLGDFYQAYQAATEETDIARRHALMAIAEAKLLSSAVMLPMTAGGGNYAISRVAPHTAPHALWGNDADRLHSLIVTKEPITAAHVAQMKEKWAQLKGTGEYEDWAEEFLTAQGYALQDSYRMAYTADPKTWDALATSRAADAQAIVNTYDGLYEYDCEGTLQSALALSHEVTKNADGTVSYTFYLRDGVKWVDSQGRTVADLTADDFVAGFQHMMDAAGGLEYLVEGLIVGASEYITGQTTDMANVGVRALDDRTLVYTLTGDQPYFLTMLGYGVFAPMSRAYYQSKGGRFGPAFDDSDPSYTYGSSPDTIAYCGPYLVTNATAENTIVFTANPAYYDGDDVDLRTVTWRFNDSKDALKAYQDALSGTIDGAGLNPSSVAKAKADGNFDRYAYVSTPNATTYFAFYNLDRQALSNFNDGGAVSEKDEVQDIRSKLALRNVHFRRALSYAVDRSAYNAQTAGEALKTVSLRNSFIPGNFVSLPTEATVSINGTEKTYPAGTYYGQILQDQLTADGLPIRVWDPEAEHGAGSSDGFDGWHDPKAARRELELAMRELGFSPEDPIYLDLPYFSGGDAQTNRAYAYKQSVEGALGGSVKIRLVPCASMDQVLYAGYYITLGEEANYDIYDMSGWGPDYGDPQTYLSTLLPGYEGYMTRMLGIF